MGVVSSHRKTTDDGNTTPRRTRLSPEQRRAQLIDLGVEMLATRPIEQISVEEIADRAGVSHGLLFHYFGSKHGYHVALVRHISREMIAHTAPDESLPPLDMLRGTLVAYVEYVTERRDAYVSMLRGSTSGDPEMREIFEATRTAMVERTVAHLPAIGIRTGPAVRLAVHGWVAFVEDTTIVWLRDHAEPAASADQVISRDEFIDLAVSALPAVTLAALASGDSQNPTLDEFVL
ncbi:MAG: TetR/AcrR family transcriptional regulator [Rhodococcus sp.]|nr:TetR/AcrR family transcriptional regulator [Rhodococcus sp. (in: high G+C Gram-positive bacteria)]